MYNIHNIHNIIYNMYWLDSKPECSANLVDLLMVQGHAPCRTARPSSFLAGCVVGMSPAAHPSRSSLDLGGAWRRHRGSSKVHQRSLGNPLNY